MKKDVIQDLRTGKFYWDDGIIRNFERVEARNITLDQAKKKWPDVIEV